jgi:fatty acid desaturase
MVDTLFGSLAQQQPGFTVDAAATAQTKSLLLLMLPAIQGAMWVIMLFAAYYMATRIVSASGRALRPREDIPSALRMNRNAIFIFLAGLAATFFGGVPAMIGATVVGTFGAGFLLSGFAALHFRTRGKDWRLPALILCYLASLILMLPAFFILVVGLSDTRKAIALTPSKNADAPKPTDKQI